MATPIKNTPTLEGNDAKIFMENLLSKVVELDSGINREQKENELRRMEKSFKAVQSISNGAF